MILRSSIPLMLVALACASGAAQQPATAKPPATANAAPSKPVAPLRQVGLHVNSESWIKGSLFPKAELTRRCNSAGIGFSTQKGELDVTIDYTEEKGSGYSLFGVGEPTAWGTGIDYKITILSVDGAEKLVERSASAYSESSGGSYGLHESARRMFMSQKGFTESCSMIPALLGSHAEQAKLLQWAATDEGGATFLAKVGFEPKTPGERAYLLVAQRQFDQLPSIGPAAAPALSHFLRQFYDFDFEWPSNKLAGDAMEAAALRAYVAIGDPTLNGVLSKFLENQMHMKETQKAALEGARDKGNRSLLKSLASWRERVQASSNYSYLNDLLPLAEEARAAIAARN